MGFIFVDAVLGADTWADRLVTTKCLLLRENSPNERSVLDVTPHTLSSIIVSDKTVNDDEVTLHI